MKKLPAWWSVLEEFMPCAPSTVVLSYKCGDQPVRYHIGGDGWIDGGGDAKMHRTRLAAIVATWEWWLS